ncbi:MAG: UDP-glucose 4-epimerase GalE [Phycisphaeraceae bacterium]|nr:MAG: UDP-glucose 4-epimerase GalE [Phycisphaeraceae bacterium]
MLAADFVAHFSSQVRRGEWGSGRSGPRAYRRADGRSCVRIPQDALPTWPRTPDWPILCAAQSPNEHGARSMNILVTGGAGYIGSHAVKRLLRDGHAVTVIDNLVRGHAGAIERLRTIAPDRLVFHEGDVGDRALVDHALREGAVEAVMHFAALAYVGESVTQPLRYHRNNTAAALSLIEACDAAGVERFIFSSTCATYGEPPEEMIPIRETTPQKPINPYGWSKLHVERILSDSADACAAAGRPFSYAALRYFNVAGSDRDGLIGEHHEPETHLIPLVLQAAAGVRDAITIFGTDYPTPDGTCIRDYVHVEDLVDAHVAVMHALDPEHPGCDRRIYNLGIGQGYSVREVIDASARVTGKKIPVKEGERRPGDPPRLFADPSKILAELGWSASITDLEQIIATAWRWMREHPKGYV